MLIQISTGAPFLHRWGCCAHFLRSSKFRLHKTFASSHVQVFYAMHVRWEANNIFIEERIAPLVRKGGKDQVRSTEAVPMAQFSMIQTKYPKWNCWNKKINVSCPRYQMLLGSQMVARKVHRFPWGGGNARPSRACLTYYSWGIVCQGLVKIQQQKRGVSSWKKKKKKAPKHPKQIDLQ